MFLVFTKKNEEFSGETTIHMWPNSFGLDLTFLNRSHPGPENLKTIFLDVDAEDSNKQQICKNRLFLFQLFKFIFYKKGAKISWFCTKF